MCIAILVGRPSREERTWVDRCTWEDNIKMNGKEFLDKLRDYQVFLIRPRLYVVR